MPARAPAGPRGAARLIRGEGGGRGARALSAQSHLEEVDLRVKLRCGSPEEQRCAGILLPLITHRPSPQLLVTLLVLNSLANEAMPIFLDALVPSTIAVLISVTAVLFVGEIIPAALFTGPSKLRIAAAMAPVVKLCMVVLSPVAYPLAIGLDWLLPHRASLQSRSEVQAMVEVQRDMAHESHDHDLADDLTDHKLDAHHAAETAKQMAESARRRLVREAANAAAKAKCEKEACLILKTSVVVMMKMMMIIMYSIVKCL